jgi:hypothetical protein
MFYKKNAFWLVAIMALVLAGCGLRRDRSTPAGGVLTETDANACFADLTAKSVKYSALPDKDFGGGCRTINTIKLMEFGTPTTNLGAMTCPVAANFAAWARYAVQPAARQYLGADVVRIETFGTYSCRNIGGGASGRLSEHSFGNAVDVSGFVLSNGRKISVLNEWNSGGKEQEFLRRLHQSACRRFTTVLGPDYNAAHRDHFHFDMARRGFGSYCR